MQEASKLKRIATVEVSSLLLPARFAPLVLLISSSGCRRAGARFREDEERLRTEHGARRGFRDAMVNMRLCTNHTIELIRAKVKHTPAWVLL